MSIGISWSEFLPERTGARSLFYPNAFSIIVNKTLFESLISASVDIGFSYHVGGVLCRCPAESLYHLIGHEMIHVLLHTVYLRKGEVSMASNIGHGHDFVRSLFMKFGHCSSLHGLVPGMIKRRSLCDIYNQLCGNSHIWMYDRRVARYIHGVVIDFSATHVSMSLDDGSMVRVCMGLVELEDPMGVETRQKNYHR